LEDVYLFSIDDLQQLVDENISSANWPRAARVCSSTKK